MTFKEKLRSGEFVVTTDVIPPKGTAVYKTVKGIELLKGRVDAINVADMPGANMRMGALAACVKIREMGIEPIMQITCRDRNRISLQSELLSAYALGVRNILCLRGDEATDSDNPGTKPVFDFDSVQLLAAARNLEKGFDMGGKRLDGIPNFCLGAVLDPGAAKPQEEIGKARLKAEAGAEFLQTQPIFDVDRYVRFLEGVAFLDIPVFAGVFILKSAASARFMNKNVAGVHIPESILQELEKGDVEKRSIDITVRLVRELAAVCSGVHLMMTTPWHDRIPRILDEAEITGRKNRTAGAVG
ncbi:MAG: methylenetetrahydrofolate reductase [Alphaproteobacteria bacterium]|uniref:Methylenetetrahydrofolate reductase n=1 Tax=Candidatus Nitrobium versatile TaxID=2884831 RepID=A0A953LVM1_9BACT|nr:methylenetetrahydrofolate reductase [Candidatus Nitrobium versatile]